MIQSNKKKELEQCLHLLTDYLHRTGLTAYMLHLVGKLDIHHCSLFHESETSHHCPFQMI